MNLERITTNAKDGIKGPLLIDQKIYKDSRGFFMESWNQKHFNSLIGKSIQFVQDNHSYSRKGVLRGLHYQLKPHSQGKLIRCIAGEIFDVAVDVRKGSKTFGKWAGTFLDAKKHSQFWIPEGFAHGFLTITEHAEVLYKTTDFWSKEHEIALRWDDKDIAIKWPKEMNRIKTSDKDNQAEFLFKLNSNQLFE